MTLNECVAAMSKRVKHIETQNCGYIAKVEHDTGMVTVMLDGLRPKAFEVKPEELGLLDPGHPLFDHNPNDRDHTLRRIADALELLALSDQRSHVHERSLKALDEAIRVARKRVAHNLKADLSDENGHG